MFYGGFCIVLPITTVCMSSSSNGVEKEGCLRHTRWNLWCFFMKNGFEFKLKSGRSGIQHVRRLKLDFNLLKKEEQSWEVLRRNFSLVRVACLHFAFSNSSVSGILAFMREIIGHFFLIFQNKNFSVFAAKSFQLFERISRRASPSLDTCICWSDAFGSPYLHWR